MRKVMIPVVLMLLVAGSAFAELDFESKSFYAQGMLTLPTGDFGDAAGTGFGGGVGMRVPYSEQLDFRAEIGYVMYGSEEILEVEYSTAMIPIHVLGEYHMKVEDPYFLLGGLGLTSVRWETEYTGTMEPGFEYLYAGLNADGSDTEFTLILGGGYEMNAQFSLEGRLNIVSDYNFLSVHGTYAF